MVVRFARWSRIRSSHPMEILLLKYHDLKRGSEAFHTRQRDCLRACEESDFLLIPRIFAIVFTIGEGSVPGTTSAREAPTKARVIEYLRQVLQNYRRYEIERGNANNLLITELCVMKNGEISIRRNSSLILAEVEWYFSILIFFKESKDDNF